MTIIADSGSTKTDWWISNNKNKIIHTQGINPFQQSQDDICAIIAHELLPNIGSPECIHQIHFYGAGCTKEKSPIVGEALKHFFPHTTNINVESDMLGAARGLCGRQKGIACILGTGSNSCFYDGCGIHTGNPALGYILGDEGSGAYIGKRLVGDILKRQFPDELCQLFFDETHETQASIIEKVYRAPLPNRFLASLSPFCARHKSHPAIRQFLIDCFTAFFLRNIISAPWQEDLCHQYRIHFVGSIAHYYQEELREAAQACGCQVGNIMQSPLEGMIKYHTEEVI